MGKHPQDPKGKAFEGRFVKVERKVPRVGTVVSPEWEELFRDFLQWYGPFPSAKKGSRLGDHSAASNVCHAP